MSVTRTREILLGQERAERSFRVENLVSKFQDSASAEISPRVGFIALFPGPTYIGVRLDRGVMCVPIATELAANSARKKQCE